jgi:hypothetical protein
VEHENGLHKTPGVPPIDLVADAHGDTRVRWCHGGHGLGTADAAAGPATAGPAAAGSGAAGAPSVDLHESKGGRREKHARAWK